VRSRAVGAPGEPSITTMSPLLSRPSIKARAAVKPTATSSEPTKLTNRPSMRLMQLTTGIPAASNRRTSSTMAASSVGTNTTASGRLAKASPTSTFCCPTSSGVSGT
jgi:hypothetical protein